MPATNTTRQAQFRERQRAAGLVQRSHWATPEQHARIADMLKAERERRASA